MKKILILATIFSSLVSAKYIGTYYAKLGVSDHFNSQGTRLKKAAEIIRQDRYNYHIRGIRDNLDTWDPFFDSKRNRDILERMLRRGNASRSALNTIVNGTPLIKVKVYDDHINVKVIKGTPKSSIN
jgi:hypothetical protein